MIRRHLCCAIVLCTLLFSGRAYSEYYYYFLPYYTSLNGYFTGVALKNCDSLSLVAGVVVHIYDSDGSLVATETKSIQANGQSVFVAGSGLNTEGWLWVTSTEPLAGLCFFGTTGSQNYMADVSLISELSTEYHVPHVAQSATWDTIVMVCNPHTVSDLVTLSYVDASGLTLYSEDYVVQPRGSLQCSLSDLVQGSSFEQGSVEISSDFGVAAFALYKNTKTGAYCYAGISAVSPETAVYGANPYNQIMTERLMGTWSFSYTTSSTVEAYYYLPLEVEENPYYPGLYGIFGTNEYGDYVTGFYDPDYDNFWLIDSTSLFDIVYVFDFTTPDQIAGCYFEVYSDDDYLETCYPMTGTRISADAGDTREVARYSQAAGNTIPGEAGPGDGNAWTDQDAINLYQKMRMFLDEGRTDRLR